MINESIQQNEITIVIRNSKNWRNLNNMLLNDQGINEKIRREIKNFFETSENVNTTYKNLWDIEKAVLRRKSIAISFYFKKEKKGTKREDTETKPHKCSYLILDKGITNICWRKDSYFNKRFWEKWKSLCSRMKFNPCISPCTKLNEDQRPRQ